MNVSHNNKSINKKDTIISANSDNLNGNITNMNANNYGKSNRTSTYLNQKNMLFNQYMSALNEYYTNCTCKNRECNNEKCIIMLKKIEKSKRTYTEYLENKVQELSALIHENVKINDSVLPRKIIFDENNKSDNCGISNLTAESLERMSNSDTYLWILQSKL